MNRPLASVAAPRVLVIEDDDDVLQLLASHLRRLGCSVSTAATGEDGLALARAERPDIVLVDICLPGIDGREVLARLQAVKTTSRARLVVTSVLDRDDVEGLGADALLPKPFTRRDVARVLASLGELAAPPGAPHSAASPAATRSAERAS